MIGGCRSVRIDLVQDLVGDLRDRVVGQLGPQRAFHMVLDVADRHPARIQRDDHVVQAAGPASTLRDQPRLEATGPVPRHRQSHVTDLGHQSLRAGPVPRVRAAPPGRVALLIAQMPSQLHSQNRSRTAPEPLQNRFDHLGEEATLPGQPQLASIRSLHHTIEQSSLDHLVDRRPSRPRLAARLHPQRMQITLVIGHGHELPPHLKRFL